jgi:uncharacterized protein YndB with AHSA1/START domain
VRDVRANATEPMVKNVVVPLDVPETFDLFTSRIATWWPLGTHSVAKERAVTCRFEAGVGGRIYEVDDRGTERSWGAVRIWEPPERVVFSWHPGRDAATAQEVEVRFSAASGGTAVHLEHRNWESLGDEAREIRRNYDTGWDLTLNRFVDGAALSGTGGIEDAIRPR